MLAQYLWVKWVVIIIKNSIYICVLLLIIFSVDKLFNITISTLYMLLGGIFYMIIVEIMEYRKWIRNGATF